MGYSKSPEIRIFVLFLRCETFEIQGKNIKNIESKVLVRISTNWNKSLFKFHLSYVTFIKEKIWICIEIRNLRITLANRAIEATITYSSSPDLWHRNYQKPAPAFAIPLSNTQWAHAVRGITREPDEPSSAWGLKGTGKPTDRERGLERLEEEGEWHFRA